MRKIALYAVCIALATPLLAQSPQDTVTKVLQAMGGPAAISKWRDLEAEGEVKFSFDGNEFAGKIRIVRKGPQSWSKTTLKFGSETFVVINAFDGKAAWVDRQGTVTDEPRPADHARAAGCDTVARSRRCRRLAWMDWIKSDGPCGRDRSLTSALSRPKVRDCEASRCSRTFHNALLGGS